MLFVVILLLRNTVHSSFTTWYNVFFCSHTTIKEYSSFIFYNMVQCCCCHTIISSSEFLYLWNLKLNFKWLSIIKKMVCLIHNGTFTALSDQAFFLKMVILNIGFSINCENLTHFKLEKRRYLLYYWSNQIKV